LFGYVCWFDFLVSWMDNWFTDWLFLMVSCFDWLDG